MGRVQCNHTEGWTLNPETGKLVQIGMKDIDLSLAPDRVIPLGETTFTFVLCPSCAAKLKEEVNKW